MSFIRGAKQVWGSATANGTLAGVSLSIGFFEAFGGDVAWAAANLITGSLLFAVTLYREIHRG